MVASPPLHEVEQLLLLMEDAHAHLLGAKHAHAEAADAVAICKHRFETARAEKLAEGVEGKNAEQREANLLLSLTDHRKKSFQAERLLSTAKLEAESASLAWDALRYRLRAFQIAADFSTGGA